MIRKILGPEISDVVTTLIETCEEIYLVGGSIRDHLLDIPSHDLDFVVKRNALKAAKICADKLGGHYYALDAERGTGRALVEIKGESIILVWDLVFPYLAELDRLQDIPRHFHSLKEHTLYVLDYCQQLLEHIYGSDIVPENVFIKSAWESLDEFQSDLVDYFSRPLHPQRQYDGLLYLAILYHDLSKVEINPVEVSGKIGFPGHAEKSADLFDKTRSNWALSKEEFQFVDHIIRNHMLPEGINGTDEANSRRVLYRFFQRSGSAGVLIGIFHLADILATYEDTITPERWKKALNTCRTLLECWFRKYNQIIAPPALLSGDEVMRDFSLAPGPQIGKLLEDVQEGQAAGIINSKEMAYKHILCLLDRKED